MDKIIEHLQLARELRAKAYDAAQENEWKLCAEIDVDAFEEYEKAISAILEKSAQLNSQIVEGLQEW
jgi:hypothetical protein